MPPRRRAGTRIVAGHWWPADYDGPPLVSFDAGLARGWGVGIGDTIRVNVLGRDIDLNVASLRDIAWQSAVAQLHHGRQPRPAAARAAHAHRHRPRRRCRPGARCCARLPTRCPTSPASASQMCWPRSRRLLDQVAAALAATGSLTLVAGALVLVGAVAAGQRRRTREAVILKALGATRAADPRRLAGGVRRCSASPPGLIAALVGTAASYGVVHYIMHIGLDFPARHARGDPYGIARHDADIRLCWHRGRAAGQGGTDAAERVNAGDRTGSPGLHYRHWLEPPRPLAKLRGHGYNLPERKQETMAFSPDYRTYPRASAATTAAVLDAGLRAYMLRVYNWMAPACC